MDSSELISKSEVRGAKKIPDLSSPSFSFVPVIFAGLPIVSVWFSSFVYRSTISVIVKFGSAKITLPTSRDEIASNVNCVGENLIKKSPFSCTSFFAVL